MDDGIYRDSDYLRDDRQGIFSLSTGNADGDLYYWNVDYSYRVITNEPEQKFNESYLDVLIGFQEWHEKVRMTKGVQEFGGTLGPFGGLCHFLIFSACDSFPNHSAAFYGLFQTT